MPFITWRGRGSFHGRIPNENEGREKARPDVKPPHLETIRPAFTSHQRSTLLLPSTAKGRSPLSPLLSSSGHLLRRCSGHVYTSVFIPLVGRANRAGSGVEGRKKKKKKRERKREEGRKKEEAQSYQSCVDWCFEERDWFSANELVEHLSRFLKNDKGDFSAGRAQASDYFTRFGRVFLGPELGRRAIRRGSSSGDDPSTITLRLCLSFSLCRGRKFTLLSRD